MLLDKISRAISEPNSLDNYIYIYTHCRKEIEMKHPAEFDSWKVDALRLFKEKQLFYPLLRILKEVENDDRETLLEKIFKEELEKENIDWKYLFPIMGSVSDKKIESLSKKYFGEVFSNKELSPEWLGEKVARVMNSCFSMIEEDYFRIVKGIYSTVQESSFLNILEHRLKTMEKSSNEIRFRILDHFAAEQYFQFLCENKAYEAANSFVDRIWDKKSGKKLFRKEMDAVKTLFFCHPSPVLLALGKTYVESRENTYDCDEWIEDIRNTEPKNGSKDEWNQIYQWLTVFKGVNCLYEKRDDEELDNISKLTMYDVNKYSYMTQICCRLAEIIQGWLLNTNLTDTQIIKNLERLGDKNVFAYETYNWYTAPYIGYSGLKEVLKVSELEERLEQIQSVENLLFIYFNTPMWCCIDFFKCVKSVNEKNNGSGKLENIFDTYLLDGIIIDEDKKTYTGKKRFSIVPRYLYWTRNKRNGKGKNLQSKQQGKYKRVMNVAEDWLTRNTEKLSSLSLQKMQNKNTLMEKLCQFKIYSFENEVLYVQDVSTVDTLCNYEETDTEVSEKEVFTENLCKWFQWIIENTQFIKWGRWEDENNGIHINITEPMKVKTDSFQMKERVEIAAKFLDVVSYLAINNQEEAWKFLRHCSFRPLENINEFRYIETQHWTDFMITENQEEELYHKAAHVMENADIPADLKLEIYMNTCARKVYPLEKLFRQNKEIEKLLCAKQTEWIVPVKFMKEKDGGTYFSMQPVLDENGLVDEMKQNVIKSGCDFYYDEEIQKYFPKYIFVPEERFVLYATIRGMKENRFELRKYFIDSYAVKRYFPWKEYKKCFYDLKELKKGDADKNRELFLKVYKELSKLRFSLEAEGKNSSLDKCKQIVCEMDEVFSNLDFDIKMCKEALLLFGEKNPFFNDTFGKALSETEVQVLGEYTMGRYANEHNNSYEKFLHDATENDVSLYDIGVVFYLSHMQLFVSERQFIKDIAQKMYRTEEDVTYYLSNVMTKTLGWFANKKAQMEEILREMRLEQQNNPKHTNKFRQHKK